MGQSCGQMSACQRQKDLRSFQLLARNSITVKDVKRLPPQCKECSGFDHGKFVECAPDRATWLQKERQHEKKCFFLGDNDNTYHLLLPFCLKTSFPGTSKLDFQLPTIRHGMDTFASTRFKTHCCEGLLT